MSFSDIAIILQHLKSDGTGNTYTHNLFCTDCGWRFSITGPCPEFSFIHVCDRSCWIVRTWRRLFCR
jgi:hypothetical protein